MSNFDMAMSKDFFEIRITQAIYGENSETRVLLRIYFIYAPPFSARSLPNFVYKYGKTKKLQAKLRFKHAYCF